MQQRKSLASAWLGIQERRARSKSDCPTVSKVTIVKAVPWLKRLVAGLSPRRPGFDPGSVHVGFVVDKVALGQVFPGVLLFSSVNFIPPVLHYTEKRKKLIIFITGLHNKPEGCGASVASAAGPFTTKRIIVMRCWLHMSESCS
jgi:hypothetical protein